MDMMQYEDYKKYGYMDDAPLISKDEQMFDYFDNKFSNIGVDTNLIENTIEHSIDESMRSIHCGIHGINHHIEDAKHEIMHDISHICTCNLATKDDVKKAVENINLHVDTKFDEEFSDLNEQIKNINNKLN